MSAEGLPERGKVDAYLRSGTYHLVPGSRTSELVPFAEREVCVVSESSGDAAVGAAFFEALRSCRFGVDPTERPTAEESAQVLFDLAGVRSARA